jgi:hypothetical protein
MRLRRLGARILPSLKAVLAGWAAAMVVTLPMQIVKIVANSFGGPAVLLLSLAEGAVIWGLWGLAIAAGGWLFGFLPVVLLVPESWLLRHLRTSCALAAIFGWMVVLVEFQVWRLLLLPDHSLAVRMFTLYSLLFVVSAAVSAFVYLRLIALKRENS